MQPNATMRFIIKIITFIFIVASVNSPAMAETIEYEIYELQQSISNRILLGKGKRVYEVSDVEVHPYESQGTQIAKKFISLEGDYKIGASIYYEQELTGFGLLASHAPDDFSWEWYNKKQDNLFEKLQGKTHVIVRITGLPMIEELAEVTFLDDTELSFIAHREGMEDTHTIIVRAGSVLRFK